MIGAVTMIFFLLIFEIMLGIVLILRTVPNGAAHNRAAVLAVAAWCIPLIISPLIFYLTSIEPIINVSK